MIHTLSIDIETYSSVDLPKAGTYRYAEDKDFSVLLFGYSADHGPVEVIDIETGETVFVIIPHDAVVPIGKALLPMESIGKVRVGQRAIIRLPAFPEQEFGFVEGCVSSVSPVPDADGNYILEITLPDGMETTYGKTLPLIKEIKGNVSVVTQERSLLENLLDKK